MKIILLIIFSIPLKSFPQPNKSLSAVFYSDWANTNWLLIFKQNNSFKFISSGHLGDDDTIRGIYKISSDTIFTKSINRKGKNDTINFMIFKIQVDTCVLELSNSSSNLNLCKQRQERPIPIDENGHRLVPKAKKP
jgi:hypothetical protein